MASLVELVPAASSPVRSVPRVRALSRGLEVLFAILFAAFTLLFAVGIWVLYAYRGDLIAFGPQGGIISTGPLPPGFIPVSHWPLAEKLAYGPVLVVRSAPAIGLFWCLRRLFGAYAQGEVFSARNAQLIQAMGVWLVADAAAPFACHLALSAAGLEIDGKWAHMASVQELVLGAVVFVIAYVMQAGHEIEQDREGFV